jgi:hypothetical protein
MHKSLVKTQWRNVIKKIIRYTVDQNSQDLLIFFMLTRKLGCQHVDFFDGWRFR